MDKLEHFKLCQVESRKDSFHMRRLYSSQQQIPLAIYTMYSISLQRVTVFFVSYSQLFMGRNRLIFVNCRNGESLTVTGTLQVMAALGVLKHLIPVSLLRLHFVFPLQPIFAVTHAIPFYYCFILSTINQQFHTPLFAK